MRKWLGLAVLAASLFGAHYAYRLWWPVDTFVWTAEMLHGRARAWAQWRFLGLQGAVLYLAVWWAYRGSPERLWRNALALVCGWGAFQQFELVVCSFGVAGQPNHIGLCTAQYGRWLNMYLAAGAFAALGVDYVRGSKDGAVRGRSIGLVARSWRVGAVTWTAVVRAYQAFAIHFRRVR